MITDLLLRGERESDYNDIYEINCKAFGGETEAKIVNAVRKTRNYAKGFSIVAFHEEKAVGHAIFTHASIVNKGRRFNCLALGPMAVTPEFQRQGVGKQLVEEGILRAKENNFKAIIVLGHKEYYPKFGFTPASAKNISNKFNAPPENFMILELLPNALKGISGVAEYAKEFTIIAQQKQQQPKGNPEAAEQKPQNSKNEGEGAAADIK